MEEAKSNFKSIGEAPLLLIIDKASPLSSDLLEEGLGSKKVSMTLVSDPKEYLI